MELTDRIDALVGRDNAILKDGPGCQEFIDYLYDESSVPSDMREYGHENFNRYTKILYKIANRIQPKLVVELGVREARSTHAFTRVLRNTGGHVYSFDPTPVGGIFVEDSYKDLWSYNELMGEEGYERYGKELQNIDLLYIDTDPHSFEQMHMWLHHYWIKNVRKGGFIVCDDCCPQHDIAVSSREYSDVWRVVKDYGIISALLLYIDENNSEIDYAFTAFNNHSNGFAVIKLGE
jgi:predicted O-methyltransferase YrrM